MPTIDYICKLCGKPGRAHFQIDAIQEAVDRWVKMLAHNECADRMRAKNDSEEAIVRVCLRFSRRSAKEGSTVEEETKKALRFWTLKYAKLLAEILGLPNYVWTEDFVELLMANPEQCGRVLANYRSELRNRATP